MNFKTLVKNRNFAYILIFLTMLAIGAIVFLNRYFYLFAKDENNQDQSANEIFDVASVEIKRLNTSVLKTNKFQSLQKTDVPRVDLNNLDKGKRNPFLPN